MTGAVERSTFLAPFLAEIRAAAGASELAGADSVRFAAEPFAQRERL
jgi:hypothetical protein